MQAIQSDFLQALRDAEDSVDIRDFTSFPDDISFEEWVIRNETWNNPFIRALASQFTSSIVGREPRDIGAHYWFDYLKSGGGWESLLGDHELGAQRHMIKSGKYLRSLDPLILTPSKALHR
jgi:monoamine oxidase